MAHRSYWEKVQAEGPNNYSDDAPNRNDLKEFPSLGKPQRPQEGPNGKPVAQKPEWPPNTDANFPPIPSGSTQTRQAKPEVAVAMIPESSIPVLGDNTGPGSNTSVPRPGQASSNNFGEEGVPKRVDAVNQAPTVPQPVHGKPNPSGRRSNRRRKGNPWPKGAPRGTLKSPDQLDKTGR